MVKVSSWKPAASLDAATMLMDVWRPIFRNLIADVGGAHYPSTDMKKGIDNARMMPYLPLLEAGLRLDPRGAYFCQETVAAAYRGLVNGDAVGKAMMEVSVGRRAFEDLAALVKWDSYALRVLWSHLRMRRDQHLVEQAVGSGGDGGGGGGPPSGLHPPEFRALYRLVTQPPKAVTSPAGKVSLRKPCPM